MILRSPEAMSQNPSVIVNYIGHWYWETSHLKHFKAVYKFSGNKAVYIRWDLIAELETLSPPILHTARRARSVPSRPHSRFHKWILLKWRHVWRGHVSCEFEDAPLEIINNYLHLRESRMGLPGNEHWYATPMFIRRSDRLWYIGRLALLDEIKICNG